MPADLRRVSLSMLGFTRHMVHHGFTGSHKFVIFDSDPTRKSRENIYPFGILVAAVQKSMGFFQCLRSGHRESAGQKKSSLLISFGSLGYFPLVCGHADARTRTKLRAQVSHACHRCGSCLVVNSALACVLRLRICHAPVTKSQCVSIR